MSDDLATTPSEPIALGTLLGGKFVLTRAIGRGGMGTVYEGTQVALRRRVAIKTLHSELARHKDLRTRFVREGELAARIRHPNVIEVIDVGEHEGTPFLVLEYLEGEDLGERLGRLGRLATSEAIDLLLPVCAAVASAHDLGVIHRDLKPENIFLLQPPRGPVIPKVVDFGISKLVDAGANAPTMAKITAEGAIIGTPLYLPPEVAAGASQLDAQSDQYTLGVILYECVTGTRPFDARTLPELVSQILSGRFESPRSVVATIPAELDAIIVRAMNMSKAARFPSVWALGRALLPFASPRVQSSLSEQFRGPNATLSERPTPIDARAQRADAHTLVAGPTRTPTAAMPASDVQAPAPRPSRSVAIGAAFAALAGVVAIGLFARSQSAATSPDIGRAAIDRGTHTINSSPSPSANDGSASAVATPHDEPDVAPQSATTDSRPASRYASMTSPASPDASVTSPASRDASMTSSASPDASVTSPASQDNTMSNNASRDAAANSGATPAIAARRNAGRDGGRRPTTTNPPPTGDPPSGTPFIE